MIVGAIVGSVMFACGPAKAQDASELVQVELLAEPAAVRSGQPFWVGVQLTIKEHWHTYWRNAGDSGLPTEITWALPAGFSAGEIVWPAPQRIVVGPLVNFGFEGRATLLTEITPPADLPPGQTAPLRAHVNFLVCAEICIPGEASVSLDLPVSGGAAVPTATESRRIFEAARASLPMPSPWPVRFEATKDSVKIIVAAEGLRAETIKSAVFFPHDPNLIDHAARQTVDVGRNALTLGVKRSQIVPAPPETIEGVLVIEEEIGGAVSRQAFALSAAVVGTAASPGFPSAETGITLGWAFLFALLGGVILNLMPCVFPVLSIKLVQLSKHSGEPAHRIRLHGLAYTAGILASFLALAGALIAIRAGGAEIGWGFQLQSPLIVAALAFVLFAMGLSLSGAVNFGSSLMNAGGSLAARPGLTGSFFTGVLATIVATPCTGPFMGAAMGFALTQPAAVGLAVFLALGMGLALPFLILSFVPALRRMLPRPGAWMETLKQLMAFPLYATVAWLVWVLSQQVGPTGLLAALCGLVLIAFAAWALNSSYDARPWPARLGQAAAFASVIAVLFLARAINADQTAANPRAGGPVVAGDEGIEPFSQARLDALLTEGGQPVFVNMTAAWCISCLVNERVVLSTPAVKAAFADKKIAYLKGDWTNQNPEITRILERHGRSGVPLYLLYGRGKDPVVLPQILTESIVLAETAKL